ncbi:hypothetical protein D3C71_79740 [compost metagenome]
MQAMLSELDGFRLVLVVLVVAAMLAVVIVPPLLEGTKPNFQLGMVGPRGDVRQAQGFIWLKSRDGGQSARAFTIDKPNLLNRPSRRVRNAMLEQIQLMGFIPTHIEIRLPDRRRVYKTDGGAPRLIYSA